MAVPTRRRVVLAHVAFLSTLGLFSSSPVFAQPTSFTNNGGNSNWNNGLNSNHGPPSAGDVALIVSNGTVTTAHAVSIINGIAITASTGTLEITNSSSAYDRLVAGSSSSDTATLSIGGGSTNGIFVHMASTPLGNFDFGIGETRNSTGTINLDLGSGAVNVTVNGGQRLNLYCTVVGTGSIVFRDNGAGGGGLVLGRGDDDSFAETANTFSGGVRLVSGILQFAEDSHTSGGVITQGPFGTGALTIEGGTIAGFKNGGGTSSGTRTIDNVVNVNGNFNTFDALSQVWNGTVNFGSTQRTMTIADNTQLHTLKLNGTLNGTAGFVKEGPGTLTLGHDNSSSLSGGITANNGTLSIGVNGALGDNTGSTVIQSGTNSATLRFSDGVNYTSMETIAISGNGVGGVGGAIYGADLFTNTFAGTVQLNAASMIRVSSGSNSGTLALTGTVNFGASSGFTLTKDGPGFLDLQTATFLGGAGTPSVTINAGTAQFGTLSSTNGANIALNGGKVRVVDSGTFANRIDIANNAVGEVHVESSSATSIVGGAIAVNGAGTSIFTKGGAGTLETQRVRVGTLTISAGAIATRADGTTSGTSKVTALALAGGTTPTATLDLRDNDFIVSAGSYNTVAAQIAHARHSGAWNDTGIMSATAGANTSHNTTLGAMTGAEYISIYGASPTFSGFTAASGDVLVKYTYYGDADFNGLINFDDYSRTDAGFNNGRSGWVNGDYDYNGVVNFDDYSLIDHAFNTQTGTINGGPDGGGNPRLIELGHMWHFRLDGYLEYFIEWNVQNGNGVRYTVDDFYPDGRRPPGIDVPEPAFLCALACGGLVMTSRRGRPRR